MPDSWPAKSPDQKLAALMPLAKRIASAIARRFPASHRDDIDAAAAIGAWHAVRSHGELPRLEAAKYATARIRGAVLDELRHLDWVARRVRREHPDIAIFGIDTVPHGELQVALSSPPEQEIDADIMLEGERLHAALDDLPERERRILIGYYIEGRGMRAMAAEEGCSVPRISQIRKRAVERLKAAMPVPT